MFCYVQTVQFPEPIALSFLLGMQSCSLQIMLVAGPISSGIPQVSTLLLFTVCVACCMQDKVYGAARVVSS